MRADTRKAWAKYASGGHEAMQIIARACASQGLSVRSFAELADRDVKVVTRWFESAHPRQETVERACRALRFLHPATVARALLSSLQENDAGVLRSLIFGAVEGFGRESLGFYAPMRATEVHSWLEGQPTSVTLDVGRRCVLVLYSLASPDVDSDVSALGPVVGAIVTALRANGYSNVFAFTHWQQSAEAKAALALEAQAWTHLLCESLGFETRLYFGGRTKADAVGADGSKPTTAPTEPKDSSALYTILAPYLKHGAAFLTKRAKRAENDLLDLDALQRFNRATRAAKRVFRETFFSSESEKQL